QWNTCLFVEADRDLRRTSGAIRPFPPYERTATRFESDGAYAPALTYARDVIWRDDNRALHRLSTCDETPETYPAPSAIAHAKRIVATPEGLWVIGETGNSVELYDDETLTRLLVVDFATERVIDIATDGHSVMALVQHDGVWQSIPIDCAGHLGEPVIFAGISGAAEAFVFLRRAKRFVVLIDDLQLRLYWF